MTRLVRIVCAVIGTAVGIVCGATLIVNNATPAERAAALTADGWTIVALEPFILAKRCDGPDLIRLEANGTSYRMNRHTNAPECPQPESVPR